MNEQNMKICEYECDECQDCGCNSNCNSNCNCNCNCNCFCECPPKLLKPNRAQLKCGSIGGVTLPALTAAGSTFTLASVTVDTRGFKRPCIKFEFASNVVTTASVITLNFQLFRQCRGQLTTLPVGPIWTFSRAVATTDANTFSFFVCDCDFCNDDCCTYSVVATVAGVATVGVTAVNNASLSALIVDGCF